MTQPLVRAYSSARKAWPQAATAAPPPRFSCRARSRLLGLHRLFDHAVHAGGQVARRVLGIGVGGERDDRHLRPARPGRARIARVAATPSMRGILMSIRIRSKRPVRAASTASTPSSADFGGAVEHLDTATGRPCGWWRCRRPPGCGRRGRGASSGGASSASGDRERRSRRPAVSQAPGVGLRCGAGRPWPSSDACGPEGHAQAPLPGRGRASMLADAVPGRLSSGSRCCAAADAAFQRARRSSSACRASGWPPRRRAHWAGHGLGDEAVEDLHAGACASTMTGRVGIAVVGDQQGDAARRRRAACQRAWTSSTSSRRRTGSRIEGQARPALRALEVEARAPRICAARCRAASATPGDARPRRRRVMALARQAAPVSASHAIHLLTDFGS